MRVSIVVFAVLAAVTAGPVSIQELQDREDRIIGGTVTTIGNYPFGAALLLGSFAGTNFQQVCGGSILNQRSILTAAHCTPNVAAARWRIRVGSTNANSGGSVHQVNQVISHPQYSSWTQNNDFAIMRVATNFVYNNNVQAATISGPNYNLADNQPVWAIGWGTTIAGVSSSASEQLRHVQIWTINQQVCAQRYASAGLTITANMLCSGWLDVGGRDQCQGDSGGPLIHNNNVVGVCSWGIGCAQAQFPGVNARVSSQSNWIANNA